MTTRKVSVVICTYNGAKFLGEQLDSVLRQDYPLHEIIVQDDASTDETMGIVLRYASQHARIKVFRNPQPLGINRNFFSALRRVTGDYVAICDQDDHWRPGKISMQMRTIGDKLLCGCHSRPFSTDGSFAYFDARRPNTHLFRMLFNNLPGHTLLFRRELLTDIMPEDNELYHVSFYDVAFCLAAASRESIAFADEVLVDHRRHVTAATYTDFHRSLPSIGNALHILCWSLRHYQEARPKACRLWHARLAFLLGIPVETDIHKEAIQLMELELRGGLLATLRLQRLFMKYHRHLFQTEGGGIVKRLRAMLYPLMQYYTYR